MNYAKARKKWFNKYNDFEFLFCELVFIYNYHLKIKGFKICREQPYGRKDCPNSKTIDNNKKEFYCYFVSHGSFKKTIQYSLSCIEFKSFLEEKKLSSKYYKPNENKQSKNNKELTTIERHVDIRNMLAHRAGTAKIDDDLVDYICGTNNFGKNRNMNHSISKINNLIKEAICSIKCKNCLKNGFEFKVSKKKGIFYNCSNSDFCRSENPFTKLKRYK